MIQNSSLKSAIYTQYYNLDGLSDYEKIATEIILYKYILEYIEQNSDQGNSINTLVSTYAGQFKTKFTELKNKYTAYLDITKYLKQISATNIFSMLEDEIIKVYDYYLNSKQIVDFDVNNFSLEAYGGSVATDKQYKYLSHIHNDVMCPIIKYYIKIYGKSSCDMKIVDAYMNERNKGKKIEFYIDGISPATIYSDYKQGKFPIKIVSMSFKYPNIVILNK